MDFSSSKMMKIKSTVSASFVVGFLVLFMGVMSVDISVVDSPPESTGAANPHPLSAFIVAVRITNRIYNDSLAVQQSPEYKTLRREVERLFSIIYGPTPLTYLGTDEMTFSDGPDSSVIASSKLLFGTTLINPVLVRTMFLVMYPQIPSPTLQIDLSYVQGELPTQVPVYVDPTNAAATTAPSGATTAPSGATTTNSTVTTATNGTITVAPNSTVTNATQTLNTTAVNQSTTAAGAGVPGWAIALLVLAAVSLLLLFILLITMAVLCCCWPSRRGLVNEPEQMSPPMYFSQDIPMYSTHSTFDTANGKQVQDAREKPPKNRTGMYVVNK